MGITKESCLALAGLLLIGAPAFAQSGRVAVAPLDLALPAPSPAEGAYLGVYVEGAAEGGGVLLADIVPGTPAEAAGLQAGDVIVALGDRTVASEDDLREAIQEFGAGQKVRITFLRDGEKRRTSARLATAPEEGEAIPEPPSVEVDEVTEVEAAIADEPVELLDVTEAEGPSAYLGVRLEPTDDGRARVAEVIEGTAAANAGLVAGDVIVRIDGEEVDGVEGLVATVQSHQPGDSIRITIERDGGQQRLRATLGSRDESAAGLGGAVFVPASPVPPRSLELPVEPRTARPNPEVSRALEEARAEIDRLRATVEELRAQCERQEETLQAIRRLLNREPQPEPMPESASVANAQLGMTPSLSFVISEGGSPEPTALAIAPTLSTATLSVDSPTITFATAAPLAAQAAGEGGDEPPFAIQARVDGNVLVIDAGGEEHAIDLGEALAGADGGVVVAHGDDEPRAVVVRRAVTTRPAEVVVERRIARDAGTDEEDEADECECGEESECEECDGDGCDDCESGDGSPFEIVLQRAGEGGSPKIVTRTLKLGDGANEFVIEGLGDSKVPFKLLTKEPKEVKTRAAKADKHAKQSVQSKKTRAAAVPGRKGAVQVWVEGDGAWRASPHGFQGAVHGFELIEDDDDDDGDEDGDDDEDCDDCCDDCCDECGRKCENCEAGEDGFFRKAVRLPASASGRFALRQAPLTTFHIAPGKGSAHHPVLWHGMAPGARGAPSLLRFHGAVDCSGCCGPDCCETEESREAPECECSEAAVSFEPNLMFIGEGAGGDAIEVECCGEIEVECCGEVDDECCEEVEIELELEECCADESARPEVN